MLLALDATYSLGRNLSGVGVYSREVLFGLARAHPSQKFLFYYRPHRFLRSLKDSLPGNARRRVLRGVPGGAVFHALNQRVDVPGHRTVCTFHDLFVMTGEYSSPEFRERFTAQARHAAARSDLIIAVSQFTARQVEGLLHVEASRIRVIPHGARRPLRYTGPAETARRERLILTVGAIQKRKNVGRLVRAFERTPRGWRLAIAGAADGYGAEEELRAVEESPRRGDIDVLGYVDDARLEELYARASIFAFPSLDEGFGMPVLDAMARGVPVVGSRRSAVPEVAGEAALLVDPESVEELGEALRQLVGDEHMRADLAIRGRERAAGFTWERAVEHTWRVYQELL
ncbi:MAG TPA: glycosyltransferase family 1 protein [Bryobacteraceae bacterium]